MSATDPYDIATITDQELLQELLKAAHYDLANPPKGLQLQISSKLRRLTPEAYLQERKATMEATINELEERIKQLQSKDST